MTPPVEPTSFTTSPIFDNKPKSILGRTWQWLKEHKTDILITTISLVAAAAIIAGLSVLTITYPRVMLPIFALASITGRGVGFFFLLFAAGSGDRGAQNLLGALCK